MSDYCVCKDCGCKHLVWENSCPYCRRIAELEAENEKYRLGMQENCQLRAELQALRETIQVHATKLFWSTVRKEVEK